MSVPPTPHGAFVVIAFVAPQGSDAATLASRILAGERVHATDSTAAPVDVDELVNALRAEDSTLAEPIADPDSGVVSLIADRGNGLDIAIDAGVLTITTDLVGVEPAAAEARFTRLLAVLRMLRSRFGMTAYLAADDQPIDPDADHERLARAWITAAQAGARAHISRLGEARNLSLVALAMLITGVAGAATLPQEVRILLLVPTVLAIPLVGISIWRRLRRTRDRLP